MTVFKTKQQNNAFSGKAPAGVKRQKPGAGRTEPGGEDLVSALAPLKPSLDAFGRETEGTLAGLETPNLGYFTGLTRETMVAAKKREAKETWAFAAVAAAFLTGVGSLLQAGYFGPVVVFYGMVSLFLPTVVLFFSDTRREEVKER